MTQDGSKSKRGWLSGLLMAFGFAVVLAAVGLCLWHASLEAAVEEQLAAIRAKGEPVTLKELAALHPEIAGENLAVELLSAHAALTPMPDTPFEVPSEYIEQARAEAQQRIEIMTRFEDDELPEHQDYDEITIAGWEHSYFDTLSDFLPSTGIATVKPGEPIHPLIVRALETHIGANESVIGQLHASSHITETRRPLDFSSAWTMTGDLGPFRVLAGICLEDAMLACHRGDAQRATDSILAGLSTGWALHDDPTMIAHLVRQACDAITTLAIEDTLARIDLNEMQLSRIASALNRIEYRHQRRSILIAERAIDSDLFQTGLVYEASGMSGAERFTRKVLSTDQYDQLQLLDYLTGMLDVTALAEQEQIAAAQAVDAPFDTREKNDSLYRWATIGAQELFGATLRVIELSVKAQAQIDLAKIGVAIERYRLAHGQLPDSLNDLTPDLMKSLPIDPFSGKPYIYRKLEPGYVVYSVGEDGTDARGVIKDLITDRIRNTTYEDVYPRYGPRPHDSAPNEECDITFFNSR